MAAKRIFLLGTILVVTGIASLSGRVDARCQQSEQGVQGPYTHRFHHHGDSIFDNHRPALWNSELRFLDDPFFSHSQFPSTTWPPTVLDYWLDDFFPPPTPPHCGRCRGPRVAQGENQRVDRVNMNAGHRHRDVHVHVQENAGLRSREEMAKREREQRDADLRENWERERQMERERRLEEEQQWQEEQRAEMERRSRQQGERERQMREEQRNERERQLREQQQREFRERQLREKQMEEERERQQREEQLERDRRWREEHERKWREEQQREKEMVWQKEQEKLRNDNRRKINQLPSVELAKLRISGYYPDDMTILVEGNKIRVIGKQTCACQEPCALREFERVFKMHRGVQTETVSATLDAAGELKISGDYNRFDRSKPTAHKSVPVAGLGIPSKNPTKSYATCRAGHELDYDMGRPYAEDVYANEFGANNSFNDFDDDVTIEVED